MSGTNTKEVTLNFPLAKSAGNLYFASKAYPHTKTWIGQAAGQLTVKAGPNMPEAQLLGLSFSYDFNDKELPKVTEAVAQLTSADFSMCTFSSSVLAGVISSPLVELRLDFAALSVQDLEKLSQTPSLETLWLTGTSIRDEQLKTLAVLPALTSIALKSTNISSQALSHLANYPALQRLHLPTSIDDKGVELLAVGGSKINELDLSYCKITDKAAESLARLSNLTMLYLNDTELGDAAMEKLSQAPKLEVLLLNGTKISDKGMGFLQEMQGLKHLEFRDTKVTEMGSARLRSKLKDCDTFGP